MRELHLDMRQAGRLPLSRVWEIFKYFKTSPPLHLLVRDFVGYKPDAQDSESTEPFDVTAFVKAADAAQMGIPVTRTVPAHIRAHIEEMNAS